MRLRKIAPLLAILSVKTNFFWVSASKTALMETLSPSRMEEMIKLHSVAQERFLSEHPTPSP